MSKLRPFPWVGFIAGFLAGVVITCFTVAFLLAPAHAKPLLVLHSAWSPPGCRAEALGREYVRWTCRITEAS